MIEVKIHKLALSTPMKASEVFYSYEDLPGFRYLSHIDINDATSNNSHREKSNSKEIKYENVNRFEHIDTGKFLSIYNVRKKRFKMISPLYMFFSSDFYHTVTCSDVHEIVKYFKQLNTSLRVSEIHLALDIISTTNGLLYDKIIMALKPGTKRRPNDNPKLQHETSKYFGELSSGNQLIVYDKGVQLYEEKKTKIKEDVCRLELRLRMHIMNNFIPSIHTIEELATYDWSFVYPKFYSFHHRCKELKQEIKAIGENWRQPIWELRDIMEEQYEVYPSNFYRDYLIDHPQLSVSVPKALANYRWTDYDK